MKNDINNVKQVSLAKISDQIVNRILGSKGLGRSTWKDSHPTAYAELIKYREDLFLSVYNTLKGKEIFE